MNVKIIILTIFITSLFVEIKTDNFPNRKANEEVNKEFWFTNQTIKPDSETSILGKVFRNTKEMAKDVINYSVPPKGVAIIKENLRANILDNLSLHANTLAINILENLTIYYNGEPAIELHNDNIRIHTGKFLLKVF